MSSEPSIRIPDEKSLIAGVDEVGRGPLAGPVIAAAVILDETRTIHGLRDSKELTARQRETLADLIKRDALAWSLGRAEADEIDRLNILQATLLAMQRAIAGLDPKPTAAMVDGNQSPRLECRVTTVVGGDRLIPAISAASILAKVIRDAEMTALDARYPGYGFAKHKGYPTPAHIRALQELGPCPQHRRSFAPVRKLL